MTPKPLYKFYRTNPALFELLKKKSLYCNDRVELNDPHDGLFLISDKLKKSILKKAVPNVKKNFSKSEIYNRIPENMIAEFADKSFSQKWFYEMLQKNGVSLRTCSFTENLNNELMWAHYADNFKGVCVEFDFNSVPEVSNVLLKVNYTNEIPFAQEISLNELKRLHTIKRKAWSHESEWRILLNQIDKIKIEPLTIQKIYFGPRTPIDKIEEIMVTCKNNYLEHVKFEKLKVDLNGVEFE